MSNTNIVFYSQPGRNSNEELEKVYIIFKWQSEPTTDIFSPTDGYKSVSNKYIHMYNIGYFVEIGENIGVISHVVDVTPDTSDKEYMIVDIYDKEYMIVDIYDKEPIPNIGVNSWVAATDIQRAFDNNDISAVSDESSNDLETTLVLYG